MTPSRRLLQALTLFLELDKDMSLPQILAFLHVADDEGLIVQDFARRTGMTQSTASRSLRANGDRTSPWAVEPATGLLEPYLDPVDRRKHSVYISPRGRRLIERLDVVLGGEAPQAAEQAPRSPADLETSEIG